jgi:D-alanyl-D-alanine dipeptidase
MQIAGRRFQALALALALISTRTIAPDVTLAADAPALPAPLVLLSRVDPTIRQDMRYAGPDNFTGAPVPGYDAAACILLRRVAEALAKVQADLRPRNLSLKVYDCYRPERAVRAFVDWAASKPDDPATRRFRPRTDKADLFDLGFISQRSAHSRGVAVDLTLIPLPEPRVEPFDSSRIYGACTGPQATRAPDSSLDFGTGYDCFDAKSRTAAPDIARQHLENRRLLVRAMQRHGFRNYHKEWWHFTHEPSDGGPAFDVPITTSWQAAD